VLCQCGGTYTNNYINNTENIVERNNSVGYTNDGSGYFFKFFFFFFNVFNIPSYSMMQGGG